MKLFGKLCAATVASTMLLAAAPTATPVAHAKKIEWGAVAGAILGGVIDHSTGRSNSGNSKGGLFGGLSNQKHAHENPSSEEKLFMLAVEENDFGTAQQMLDAGVDINGVYPGGYPNGRTAFGTALAHNNREMMQFLLERGANVNGWYTYNGNYYSYLEHILDSHDGRGDTSTIQYLIDWGANINEYSVNTYGKKIYPIDHCTRDYDSDISCYTASFMIEHGAYLENKDNEGMTPFLRATMRRQTHLMNVLANGGANINARDAKGRNAAQIAIDGHHMDTYKEVQEIMTRGQQPSKYQDKKTEYQKKK